MNVDFEPEQKSALDRYLQLKTSQYLNISGQEVGRQDIENLKSDIDKTVFRTKRFFEDGGMRRDSQLIVGKVQSGKTKVHDLFTYLVLTRQLVQSDVFRKKPIQKNFTEYSKAMMAFEFFKFGDHQDGWTFGSERLCNQGPNMATQSEALVLPDTGGSTTQILWLWVAQQ